MNFGRAILGIVVLAGALAPTAARAQTYDFATCDPAVTASTICSATVTQCCTIAATASSAPYLKANTSDYALVIPLDRCHQRPGNANEGNPNKTDGTSPYWCYEPLGGGDAGMYEAYGLVYRLLQTQRLGAADAIPVYWVVNPSKDPPALTDTQPVVSQTYIAEDIDMWIMSSATATPPAAGSALTALPVGETAPVKQVTLSSSGGISVLSTYTYDRRELPLRGGAFLIAAADRAKFDKFIKRQAPYDSGSMPFQGRSGCGQTGSCADWSNVDMFEIQPTASIGWTDFGSGTFHAGEAPVAATLDYDAPRIARLDGGAVSQLWLAKARLNDAASAGCKTATFSPIDAVYCSVTAADISSNSLITGSFGWLWLDQALTSCTTMWTNVRTFVTQQAGLRAAGNALLIDRPISTVENCANSQLLGAEVSGWGLNTTLATVGSEPYILRYPQNLFMQFGDLPVNFSSSSVMGWFFGGGTANGYNSAFGSGTNTLHRLVTRDVASFCSLHKSTVGCDGGEIQDYATYGRFQNDTNNGLVFYLPGNQISNRSSQLRMVLNALIATPLSVVPVVTNPPIEVSRNSPIVATVSGNPAVFQGTYEVLTPTPPVTTFSVNGDAASFRFPYFKGHLRARVASTISTVGSSFSSGSILLDAADGIPSTSSAYAGCGTHFTNACRTIFTTTDATAGTTGITRRFFEASNLSTIGPIIANNLSTANQTLLMQRVIAGDDTASAGTFIAKLGGVDRSTVAVIATSDLVSATRPTIAYFGASDGMLHAVCVTATASASTGCTSVGQELWAYIPRKLLPLLRYNTGRIDGSPRVVDAFGDFYGTGQKSWRTILTFQTASGTATAQDRVPATYALDVSDPTDPRVLWEHSIADTSALGTIEPGLGLTLAMGPVRVGTALMNMTFIQTNNLGTSGTGSVVTAINTETGALVWRKGQIHSPNPRSGGNNVIPITGVPAGVVGIDKNGQGYLTDIVFATLYGELWELDPSTGDSRYTSGSTDIPLFKYSTDFHPIGAKPSIYSNGNQQFAVIGSGGFMDRADTHWACNAAAITSCTSPLQRILAVNLDTPAADATLDETDGAPNIPFNLQLAAGARVFASAFILGNELFATTDSDDVNSSSYGTGSSSTGAVMRYDMSTGTTSTVVVQGGASSIANSGGTLYSGAGNRTMELSTPAAGTTGTSVDPAASNKVTRELWLRTE